MDNQKLHVPGEQAVKVSSKGKSQSSERILNSESKPDHLLVLVHGILASPSDWTYVKAQLTSRLGNNFMIYASSSNTYTKTLSGIDEAGKRLADEVVQIVNNT